MHHIWKAKRRGYNYCTMGILPKKEGACPKGTLTVVDYKNITDPLQKSDIDYKVY